MSLVLLVLLHEAQVQASLVPRLLSKMCEKLGLVSIRIEVPKA